MLAFFTRRKDTQAPDTTAAAETTETDVPAADDNILMRFITQGGATVELHHQDRTVRTHAGSVYALPDRQTRVSHGFNWRCLGCDLIGGGGRYGLGSHHFDETQKFEARNEANQHATDCRALPKTAA